MSEQKRVRTSALQSITNIRHIIFLLQLKHWCLRQRNSYWTECQNIEIRVVSKYRLKFKEHSCWRPALKSRYRWCWSNFILFLMELNVVYQKKVSQWRKLVPHLSAFRIKLEEKEHSDRVYNREGGKELLTKSLSSITKVPKVATPFKDDCSPLLKWIIRGKR